MVSPRNPDCGLLIMKKLLVFAVICVLVAGCGTTRETARYVQPRSYSEAMDGLGVQLVILEKNVVGGQMGLAQTGAERTLQLAIDVGKFDPQRAGETEDDYREFGAQTDDLRRASDRLLYYVQHRRREDARDQVLRVIERYNKLSLSYGPGRQIKSFERTKDETRPVSVTRDQPGNFR